MSQNYLNTLPDGFLADYLMDVPAANLQEKYTQSSDQLHILRSRLRSLNIWPASQVVKAVNTSGPYQSAVNNALAEPIKELTPDGDVAEREEDIHENGEWRKNLFKTRVHTLAQLVEVCQIDLTQWEIIRFEANKWEVGAKDKNNELKIKPLYQVKAVMRPKILQQTVRAEIEAIKAEILSGFGNFPTIIQNLRRDGNAHHMLELDAPDLHMGKMAHDEESGENYDSDIAETMWVAGMEYLTNSSCANHEFNEIWLPIGNDMINADNSANTTTRGTPQACDTRHYRTFRRTRQMIADQVSRLLEIAPVKIITVAGNHDRDTSFYLGEALAERFRGNAHVTVDNSPAPRKYHRYGANLIGYDHGDMRASQLRDLPLIMATDVPELWGQTVYREMHLGHWHKSKLEESHGVITRFFPALCAADAWHVQEGFTKNLRTATALIWHHDKGLVGQHLYTV